MAKVKLLTVSAKAAEDELSEFETFLESVDQLNLDEDVFSEIDLRVQVIKDLNTRYKELHIQIAAAATDEAQIPNTAAFFNRFVSATVKANSLSNRRPKRSNSIEALNSVTETVNKKINAKLPELTVPEFNGEFTSFTSYYETFTALIHKNPSLTSVEKFIYLRDSLKGSAAQLIADMQPSADNYKIALDMLCERFDNPKLIINNHIKGIFDLKTVAKDNAAEMRSLYDNLSKHIRALENIKIPFDYRAVFISHILISKFDSSTLREFSKLKPREIPTLDEINKFLKERCQALEEVQANKGANISITNNNSQPKCNPSKNNYWSKTNNQNNYFSKPKGQIKQSFALTGSSKIVCPNCKGSHSLNHCHEFLVLSPQQKIDRATDLRYCKNCLYHSIQQKCNSRYKCQVCSSKHHTLLHLDQKRNNNERSNAQSNYNENDTIGRENFENSVPGTSQATRTTLSCFRISSNQVILPTAIILVRDKNKKWHKARVLLDSGSHINLITDTMSNKLQLTKNSLNTRILGINCSASNSNSCVNLEIGSLSNNYRMNLNCIVIEKIAETLPLRSFNKDTLKLPDNISLADNGFNVSSKIDLLIGAAHFYELLCVGQFSLGANKPILQKTLLGWVVSGEYGFDKKSKGQTVGCTNVILNENIAEANEALQRSVEKFWQVENVHPKNENSKLSPGEQFCESHFQQTISRDSSGRFVVSIPFNSKLGQLGESKERALQRFLSLETKLAKNRQLCQQYVNFMCEYESLGHMRLVSNIAVDDFESNAKNNSIVDTLNSNIAIANVPAYYLPHHAVLKAGSLTTKLRVVFDGSAKTTTGVSINDAQIAGPVVQNDIFSILLRFRQNLIALTGDRENVPTNFS